jgi:hypothetical protein
VTATPERYATAAELLRRLASHPDRLMPNGDGGLAEALEVAVQACEQVEDADRARGDAELECEEALVGVAELWSLVERAAEVVDAHIAREDGGDWATLTLAFELHQAMELEPDERGARLLGELHAARVAVRAAGGLAAAVQHGDRQAVGRSLVVFQHAHRAWRVAVVMGRTAGEVAVAAEQGPR